MDKIFVFGHKNPDTDAVTSAISLSYLRNLNNKNTIPCILGEMNNETKFVLDYFKIPKHKYLNDTKLQVSDLKYKKGCFLNEYCTINDLYNLMQQENVNLKKNLVLNLEKMKENFLQIKEKKKLLKK